MLKHATINRTSRAQQTLQLQRHWQFQRSNSSANSQEQQQDAFSELAQDEKQQASDCCDSGGRLLFDAKLSVAKGSLDEVDSACGYYRSPSPQPPPLMRHSHFSTSSCNPSPSPSLLSSSLLSTPTKYRTVSPTTTNNCNTTSSHPSTITTPTTTTTKCPSDFMIKVFAQSLSQQVEYVTLRVTTQTKSQQIIKSLLRKFRMKHRDPNLFYLTLERFIRVDGYKQKSVMLLSDEALPLQLQQCCSNPPHNDIKFTLLSRAGEPVKIFCSDVVPNACYKCLALSDQTSVDETIELMLHILDLAAPGGEGGTSTTDNNIQTLPTHPPRQSNSPSSTSSSASSSCSTSSGIESDCNPNQNSLDPTTINNNHLRLDSDSRASSTTSISSTSNISSISSGITEQYCLVVECKDTSFRRILGLNEYLVEVYRNLLVDAKIQQPPTYGNDTNSNYSPDHWFLIKLKRRDDLSIINQHQPLKFTNPRQNVPLPPIPISSLDTCYNANNLHSIVSTTQIEVNHRSICNNLTTASNIASVIVRDNPLALEEHQHHYLHQATASTLPRQPPPPQFIILPQQPPIRPRRRNISNISSTSTFGRPLPAYSNRRRYDPAQLADDLNKLDFAKEADQFVMPLNDKMSSSNDVGSCEITIANNSYESQRESGRAGTLNFQPTTITS